MEKANSGMEIMVSYPFNSPSSPCTPSVSTAKHVHDPSNSRFLGTNALGDQVYLCLECKASYSLNSLKNRDKFAGYSKAYYLKNRDKVSGYQKAYRLKNRDKVYAQKKAYYLKNRDKVAAKSKAYHLKNRDKVSGYQKAYYLKNRDKWKGYYLERKSRGGDSHRRS